MKVSLEVYSLRLKERRSREGYLKLDDLDGGQDFLDICESLFQKLKSEHDHDEPSQQIISVERFEKSNRYFEGLLKVGQYGLASEVFNAETREVDFQKNSNHADLIPFFFRLDVPLDATEATLILQKNSGLGVKGSFVKNLRSHLSQILPTHVFHANPIWPKELMEYYLTKGQVQRIRFIKIGLTSDIADSYDEGHGEESGSMELVVRAKRNSFLPISNRIRDFLESKSKSITTFYELKDTNFEYDDVKLDVKVGNEKRTLKLNDLKTSASYDVSSQLRWQSSGHPTYASMQTAARQLASDLAEGYHGGAK